jgi:hypothetical protein
MPLRACLASAARTLWNTQGCSERFRVRFRQPEQSSTRVHNPTCNGPFVRTRDSNVLL